MGALKDLTGQKFGKWEVLHRAPNQKNLVYWTCRCECGTIRDVRSTSLINGTSSNCGCVRKQKLTNQTIIKIGDKYNKLTVIEKTDLKTSGYSLWKCLCDCGNISYVTSSNLRSGHTKSCGCLIKDIGKQKIKDLKGQRFGKLLVKDFAFTKNYKAYWTCLCDCGNTKNICGTSLTSGLTKSCGCIKSRGELIIIQILDEHHIQYQTQRSFENCRFPDTNHLALFDFYIDNKYIIEFDGQQHFYKETGSWTSFQTIKNHDEYKNNWCKENNIPIIRIPYTKYDSLCIEDLLLETSQFIT